MWLTTGPRAAPAGAAATSDVAAATAMAVSRLADTDPDGVGAQRAGLPGLQRDPSAPLGTELRDAVGVGPGRADSRTAHGLAGLRVDDLDPEATAAPHAGRARQTEVLVRRLRHERPEDVVACLDLHLAAAGRG